MPVHTQRFKKRWETRIDCFMWSSPPVLRNARAFAACCCFCWRWPAYPTSFLQQGDCQPLLHLLRQARPSHASLFFVMNNAHVHQHHRVSLCIGVWPLPLRASGDAFRSSKVLNAESFLCMTATCKAPPSRSERSARSSRFGRSRAILVIVT
jgi:hypothetical protein